MKHGKKIVPRKKIIVDDAKIKIPYNLYQRIYQVARQEQVKTPHMIIRILEAFLELRKELGPLDVYRNDAGRDFNGSWTRRPASE